jgi:uncharacterized membrane protein YjjP (DUF1212 family)
MEVRALSCAEAMDVALEVAVTVLNSGGATRMADKAFHNVATGCGHKDVSAIFRLDLATAANESTVTIARNVGPINVNLLRASEAARLGERVLRSEISGWNLKSELARIRALPEPYSQLTTLVALTASTVGFVRLAHGDWVAASAASIAAIAGLLFRAWLTRRNVPGAPANLAGGILAASLAALVLRFGLTETRGATIIGSLLFLLPGLALVNGFVDVLSEKYLVMGLERLANAALQAIFVAIAIQFAVVIAT